MVTARDYPTGTVTFLFTDIEGSTRLWEEQPAAMHVALTEHDAILRAAMSSSGGVVFKTIGDAFCAAFVRPQDALAAAIEAQRALAAHRWPAPLAHVCVRMGIHTGTAVESDGDYFGPTVNRVARLTAVGHGDQILVSNTSASLLRGVLPAGVTLRDLGTHRLKDLSEAERTYQVVADGLRAELPPLRSLESRPNNLPFQISSFLGRESELAEVRAALAQHRLVTIVGPGGIGKTRLALQAAGEAIDTVNDGAWIVQLAALRAPESIAQATAEVLSVREEPQTPLDRTIVRTLAERDMLLVFDSAEHVIPETAAFVKLLLSRCAAVRILVTSREPLHLTGERVVRISALRSAVELFRERAREVDPGRAFDERDAELIDDICRRLEGIPLAIELAAARSATMPLADLRARLSKRLQVLVSRDSTREERHRTLRGTIAWSYGLLDARDAAVLRRLAAFDGTFTAAAVADVTGDPEDDDLDVLDALVGKSLVACRPSAEGARYALFDTVREFLTEMLDEAGALDDLRRKHFAYYARFVSSMTANARAGESASSFDAIAAESTNVRAALEWGLVQSPPEAAALLCELSGYFKVRGSITEGRAWFRRFLAEPRVDDASRAALLRRAATFATEQDDYDEARSLNERCRVLYERLGDVRGVAETLHNLAVIEQRCGRTDEAAVQFAAAIERFREAGDDRAEGVALLNVARLSLARDDLGDAERRIEAAQTAAARTGDADLRGHIGVFRGDLALKRGDLAAAVRSYDDALALASARGRRYDVADIQNSLVTVAVRQGRFEDALSAARESLRTALELEASSLVIYGFEAFCEIALHQDRLAEAARYYGLARNLRRVHSYHYSTVRSMNEIETLLRARLGDGFDAAAGAGAELDWRAVAASLCDQTPVGG